MVYVNVQNRSWREMFRVLLIRIKKTKKERTYTHGCSAVKLLRLNDDRMLHFFVAFVIIGGCPKLLSIIVTPQPSPHLYASVLLFCSLARCWFSRASPLKNWILE
jgi:hypothetical protein